jgi:hypothetical protein
MKISNDIIENVKRPYKWARTYIIHKNKLTY